MSSPTRSSATSSPPVSDLSLHNLSPISIEFSIYHYFTDFFNLEMDKSDVLLLPIVSPASPPPPSVTGESRETARKGMVVALSQLRIEGEIRTTYEYVMNLLERPGASTEWRYHAWKRIYR